jgi:hypothetical protein
VHQEALNMYVLNNKAKIHKAKPKKLRENRLPNNYRRLLNNQQNK